MEGHNFHTRELGEITTFYAVFVTQIMSLFWLILRILGDKVMVPSSHLGFCFENKELSIPACGEIVNGSGVKFHYVLVADDTFGLRPHMVKPYPGQKLTIAQHFFQLQIIQG